MKLHPLAVPALFFGMLVSPGYSQSAQSAADAAARQKDAIAAMQNSLAAQQASIRRQAEQAGNSGFFVLPRATSLGVNAAMPSYVPAPPPVADCNPLPSTEVDSLVGQTAERDGLSADLLRSVMKQESGFRPCAVSSKGAVGLMQLMPSTAEQFGIANPFDAASNLDAGARFLKQLLTRYGGDLPKALGAYNAGPAKVDATGAVPQIPETLDYVRSILMDLSIK